MNQATAPANFTPATRPDPPPQAAKPPPLPEFREELSHLRSIEAKTPPDEMLVLWGQLYECFPHEPQAFRFLIRALVRAGRAEDASTLLDDAPELAETPQEVAQAAEWIAELRDVARANALFFRLLDRDPDNPRLITIFGKYLKGAGDLRGAKLVLGEIPAGRHSPTSQALFDETCAAVEALEQLSPGLTEALPDPGRVLAAALSAFRHRSVAPLAQGALGGISLYTGSLGAGGAERQLTRIASALHAHARMGRPIAGRHLVGAVDVIVNSADAAVKKDFFRPELEAAGVPVTVVRQMPRTRASELPGIPALLQPILSVLSPHPRFGLEYLVAHLRRTCPDVLYIWQDGAVLTGALAALTAGVPRIAISLRGLPPSMRPHLMKPEYREMYRALGDVPGVSFSCNSAAAAAAYADWLGLDPSKFAVLYNASQPLSTEPENDEDALWQAFDAATDGAGRTIGGIFRFNENKRWDLWLHCAAERLKAHPGDRFVLVGDGEDRATAEDLAKSLGIGSRVLFTGNSKNVGFWLAKMDALLHLSRHEGLPNVLIEAQMAGIPVVATPAGGTSETFVDGQSGLLLPTAEAPVPDHILSALDTLFEDAARLQAMSRTARQIALERFDMDRVLERTLAFFEGHKNRSERPGGPGSNSAAA